MKETERAKSQNDLTTKCDVKCARDFQQEFWRNVLDYNSG